MTLVNLLLLAWVQIQSPAQTVIVGLADGQQLVLQNPQFTGFIQNREGDAALMYRQTNFHGELSLKSISRIDFGEYRKGKPFPLTVTLKGGQKIQVDSERRDFLLIKGDTDLGRITVKHPDPLSVPVKLSTSRLNRKDSLTIVYLEFPGS
jgi:hypothetical protein